jgi:ligand-binding sensor domain-containing protein
VGRRIGVSHRETLRDSERQRPVLRRGRQFRPRSALLYEDSGGNLWAGAATGLWRWKPGPPKLYPMPDPPKL